MRSLMDQVLSLKTVKGKTIPSPTKPGYEKLAREADERIDNIISSRLRGLAKAATVMVRGV